MLTYTLRFKKLEVRPNITVDYYTVDRYKEGEFLNGQITVHTKELMNKVSTIYETTIFRLKSILNFKNNSSNQCTYFNVVQFIFVLKVLNISIKINL